MYRVMIAVTVSLLVNLGNAHAADTLDNTPRTVVMSAFEEELTLLLAATSEAREYRVNGVRFTTGTLSGKPVVLFLSGVSMTNAAMNTQLALDRFNVRRIVFSGIAGGVNPALHIGDVSVPAQWASYLEALFARETAPGKFTPSDGRGGEFANFDMMFIRPVRVRRADSVDEEQRFWFPVDSQLLTVTRALKDVPLDACADQVCLNHPPKLVIDGNGVSGQAFVDNARFREYAFKTFSANVLDMESSAVAQVAYANGVPYIVFRSLSDLAGGGEGGNELKTFFRIAANNSARVVMAFLKALP